MKRFFVIVMSVLCLGAPTLANATSGNAFAANTTQTVISPLGGSYTISFENWINNSGTVRMDYINFHLPSNDWIYNGQWVYTGNLLPNGNLEGTLKGKWAMTGVNLGYGASGINYDITAVFSGGFATLNISFVQNGQTITLQPLRFTQATLLAYLM